jgi:hypothetical protein
MAGNSRTTFAKRQKERARQEKQAEKAERKNRRKLEQTKDGDLTAPQSSGEPVITYNDEGVPEGLNFDDF